MILPRQGETTVNSDVQDIRLPKAVLNATALQTLARGPRVSMPRAAIGVRCVYRRSRTVAKNHFRMEQMEAVLSGWSMKERKAVQSRSVNASSVRAMKSQNQSALSRNHRRSIGLKSGE